MKNHTPAVAPFFLVRDIIAEILELEPESIAPETYVFRDLPTESIDLMEYGIGIHAATGIQVKDSIVFCKDMRFHIAQAQQDGTDTVQALAKVYPHLDPQRIATMLDDLEHGPVLQVRDIVAYVEHATTGR